MSVTAASNRRRLIERFQRNLDPKASGFVTYDSSTVLEIADPTLDTSDLGGREVIGANDEPESPLAKHSSLSSYINSKNPTTRVIPCYLNNNTVAARILENKQIAWEARQADAPKDSQAPSLDRLAAFISTEVNGSDADVAAGDIEMCIILPRLRRNKDGSLNMRAAPTLASTIRFTMNKHPTRPWQGTVKMVIEHSGREGGKRMVELILSDVERVAE